MIEQVLEALTKNATIWQIGLVVIIVVAGSSAVAALIKSLFDLRTASMSWRRQVRDAALQTVGEAHALYLTLGDPDARVDPRAGEKVAAMSARVRVAVAKIGETEHLDPTAVFTQTGEFYAARDADTSVSRLDKLFANLVFSITKGIPK